MVRRNGGRYPFLLPLLAASLLGATTTSSPVVSVSVAAHCQISTSPFSFGAYDPVTTNKSAALNVAANAISVACTKASPSVTISLDNGLHFNSGTSQRFMADTNASHTLQYELYSDAGRTTVWNTANAKPYVSTGKASQSLTVYGRVPAGQDAFAGSNYADTIVATINY